MDRPANAPFPGHGPAPPRVGACLRGQGLVPEFLAALATLFDGSDPATRERLVRALKHPADCPRCAAACHVFQGSVQDESLRPGFRAEILRRVFFKYLERGGRFSIWWHGDVQLDERLICRLAEMAFHCNLCERCTACCQGADHAFLAASLRSIFEQIGLAPEIERASGADVRQTIAELDELISRRAGIRVRTPWDVKDADVLVVQPVSASAEWPENVGALAVVLTAAGINWTMSSEAARIELPRAAGISDQAADIAQRYSRIARDLKAKKIVLGESGELFGLLCFGPPSRVVAGVPRESSVSLLYRIFREQRVEFDPIRNDFPVTLHDPCKLVRHGLVEPQRELLRRLCPQFREMDPWAAENYCCGGCGGLVHMADCRDWRLQVAGRKKIEQVLDAFSECLDADSRKYVCAPCSDCTRQIRDLLQERAPWEKNRIRCGGLAELVANAMAAVQPSFLNWEPVQ